MFGRTRFLDTTAGRLALGATVRSTTSSREGLITEFVPTGQGEPTVMLNDRHGEQAANLVLVAPPEPTAEAIISQDAEPVLSGTFEVMVPGQYERVYFADTPEQVIRLLARLIGIRNVAQETADLARMAEGQAVDLRFRGSFGIVGQLAYVYAGHARELPRFGLGQQVHRAGTQQADTVTGIQLHRRATPRRHDGGHYEWFYVLASDPEQQRPCPESELTAAQMLAA
jgi:hypothetical protein